MPAVMGSPAVLARRFWAKVDKSTGADGCWRWKGAHQRSGHGQLTQHGQPKSAHRVSWEMAFGAIPPGHQVCHRCDNPPCVNPRHLFLGKARDNHRDMVEKGRARFTFSERPELVSGVNNCRAKLKPDQVREIRAARAKGETRASLAARFGVTPQNITYIFTRTTWRSS